MNRSETRKSGLVRELYKHEQVPGIFNNESGTFLPVGKVLGKLTRKYRPKIIPIEPLFCASFAEACQVAIARRMNEIPPEGIDLPQEIQINTFLDNGRIVSHASWQEEVNAKLLHRSVASDELYLLAIDYHNGGKGFQVMIQKFYTAHPDHTSSILIMDSRTNAKSIGSGFLFSESSKTCPELAHTSGLRSIMTRLTGDYRGSDSMPDPSSSW